VNSKRYLIWLFYFLAIMGGVTYTLSFFGIGKELFDTYNNWFIGSLLIGVIGSLIFSEFGKNKAKVSSN